MKKKLLMIIMATVMTTALFTGCTDDTADDTVADSAMVQSEDPDMQEQEESLSDMLSDILTVGYAGKDESGADIYWAVDDEVTMGLFVYVPQDSDPVVLAGDITHNDDDSWNITDSESGDSLNLTVDMTSDDDGETVYMLTAENGAIGALYEVPVSNVLDAMEAL